MSESIIDISRRFFEHVVKPILETHFPAETARTAFGVFGYGSEALRLDDQYSRDHHWGLRIDAVMPDDVYADKRVDIAEVLAANMPKTFEGHALQEGMVAGAGLSPDTLSAMLRRTVGLTGAPQSYEDWLNLPEEDVIHIINGEVWYDPLGEFSAIRAAFKAYYPEPVRLRRIAHWCRYFSGMGTYALRRAILRNNDYYCNITFSRALRLGAQLAFLLEKEYCPYDKWTIAYLARLPRLGQRMLPLIDEAVSLTTGWERKLDLLHQITDVLDETMVADGIINAHPKFAVSPTSGYRLMEHAYAEIIQGLPDEIKTIVPVWDQIYMEAFHSGYVDTLDMAYWDDVLQLRPVVDE